MEQVLLTGRREAPSKAAIAVMYVFYIIFTRLQLDSLVFVTLLLLFLLWIFFTITMFFGQHGKNQMNASNSE